MSPEFLFLFDIDGTLIISGKAGESSLYKAVETRFQTGPVTQRVQMAGATDGSIARELLTNHGLEPSVENITALLDTYLEILEKDLPEANGTILPGILEILELLHAHPDCALALLTGNVRRGAQIKLSHYGVWHFFEFGAFADDHHDRNHLGPVAKARAKDAHGKEFPPEKIFVLGDTPKDIACGKVIGAKTVAIATGNYTAEQLAEHNPDFLFTDLSNPADKVRQLLA